MENINQEDHPLVSPLRRLLNVVYFFGDDKNNLYNVPPTADVVIATIKSSINTPLRIIFPPPIEGRVITVKNAVNMSLQVHEEYKDRLFGPLLLILSDGNSNSPKYYINRYNAAITLVGVRYIPPDFQGDQLPYGEWLVIQEYYPSFKSQVGRVSALSRRSEERNILPHTMRRSDRNLLHRNIRTSRNAPATPDSAEDYEEKYDPIEELDVEKKQPEIPSPIVAVGKEQPEIPHFIVVEKKQRRRIRRGVQVGDYPKELENNIPIDGGELKDISPLAREEQPKDEKKAPPEINLRGDGGEISPKEVLRPSAENCTVPAGGYFIRHRSIHH